MANFSKHIKKFIKQKTKNDCGQACLAMILGKSLAEVCKLIKTKGATSPEQHIEVLRNNGFLQAEYYEFKFPMQLPHLGILYVVNKRKLDHAIVKDGFTLIDPQLPKITFNIAWDKLPYEIECFIKLF